MKMQTNTVEYIIRDEKELDEIAFDLISWDRIFFVWDLGVGKSTFIRYLLRRYTNNPKLIEESNIYVLSEIWFCLSFWSL